VGVKAWLKPKEGGVAGVVVEDEGMKREDLSHIS